ncbi:hypothetical protein HDU85_003488 [Gaertneriomyces sp. JEL0708]|nr:hypothetical protein HDU85_003488 [Gaertneriomyces sp. JEL0708]
MSIETGAIKRLNGSREQHKLQPEASLQPPLRTSSSDGSLSLKLEPPPRRSSQFASQSGPQVAAPTVSAVSATPASTNGVAPGQTASFSERDHGVKPDLASLRSLLTTLSSKKYASGYLYKKNELNFHGRPLSAQSPPEFPGDRNGDWGKWWAELRGTKLKLWRVPDHIIALTYNPKPSVEKVLRLELDPSPSTIAAIKATTARPVVISIREAVTEVLPNSFQIKHGPGLATPPPIPFTSLLALSTSGSNLFYMATLSTIQCNTWVAAIRLAVFEMAKLDELLTLLLLQRAACVPAWKELGISPQSTRSYKGDVKFSGIVEVRSTYATKWKAYHVVAKRSSGKGIGKKLFGGKKKSSSLIPDQLEPTRRPRLTFYEPKVDIKKAEPIFVLDRISAAHIVCPDALAAVEKDEANVLHMEGAIVSADGTTEVCAAPGVSQPGLALIGTQGFGSAADDPILSFLAGQDTRPAPHFVQMRVASAAEAARWAIAVRAAFNLSTDLVELDKQLSDGEVGITTRVTNGNASDSGSETDPTAISSNPLWGLLYLSTEEVAGLNMAGEHYPSVRDRYAEVLEDKRKARRGGFLMQWNDAVVSGEDGRREYEVCEVEKRTAELVDWVNKIGSAATSDRVETSPRDISVEENSEPAATSAGLTSSVAEDLPPKDGNNGLPTAVATCGAASVAGAAVHTEGSPINQLGRDISNVPQPTSVAQEHTQPPMPPQMPAMVVPMPVLQANGQWAWQYVNAASYSQEAQAGAMGAVPLTHEHSSDVSSSTGEGSESDETGSDDESSSLAVPTMAVPYPPGMLPMAVPPMAGLMHPMSGAVSVTESSESEKMGNSGDRRGSHSIDGESSTEESEADDGVAQHTSGVTNMNMMSGTVPMMMMPGGQMPMMPGAQMPMMMGPNGMFIGANGMPVPFPAPAPHPSFADHVETGEIIAEPQPTGQGEEFNLYAPHSLLGQLDDRGKNMPRRPGPLIHLAPDELEEQAQKLAKGGNAISGQSAVLPQQMSGHEGPLLGRVGKEERKPKVVGGLLAEVDRREKEKEMLKKMGMYRPQAVGSYIPSYLRGKVNPNDPRTPLVMGPQMAMGMGMGMGMGMPPMGAYPAQHFGYPAMMHGAAGPWGNPVGMGPPPFGYPVSEFGDVYEDPATAVRREELRLQWLETERAKERQRMQERQQQYYSPDVLHPMMRPAGAPGGVAGPYPSNPQQFMWKREQSYSGSSSHSGRKDVRYESEKDSQRTAESETSGTEGSEEESDDSEKPVPVIKKQVERDASSDATDTSDEVLGGSHGPSPSKLGAAPAKPRTGQVPTRGRKDSDTSDSSESDSSDDAPLVSNLRPVAQAAQGYPSPYGFRGPQSYGMYPQGPMYQYGAPTAYNHPAGYGVPQHPLPPSVQYGLSSHRAPVQPPYAAKAPPDTGRRRKNGERAAKKEAVRNNGRRRREKASDEGSVSETDSEVNSDVGSESGSESDKPRRSTKGKGKAKAKRRTKKKESSKK